MPHTDKPMKTNASLVAKMVLWGLSVGATKLALDERLTGIQIGGGALALAAVCLTHLPGGRIGKKGLTRRQSGPSGIL